MASKLDKLHQKVSSETKVKGNKNNPKAIVDFYNNTGLPENINIDLIEPNPNNIRKVDTESESFKELAESIKDHGLQQNLVVYKKEEKDAEGNDRFVLLTGHRRFAAIKKLRSDHPKSNKFSAVPCLIVKISEDTTHGIPLELEEQMLIATTNINFESLSRHEMLRSLKIAFKYYGLKHPEKKSKGIISEEVSESMGITPRQINNLIRFDERLIPELKAAFFENEQLTFRMANYLCKLNEENQRKCFESFKTDLDEMTIASCKNVLNEQKKTEDPNILAGNSSKKQKKQENIIENDADSHRLYPALPDNFSKNKISDRNGKRQFNHPDMLEESEMEADPATDLQLIVPEALYGKKMKLGKTAYRKYATAMNQINKQLCTIHDLLNDK